jgi:hypothetical protein
MKIIFIILVLCAFQFISDKLESLLIKILNN